MKKWLDNYLTYLANEKGRSFNTIVAYKTDLEQFFAWVVSSLDDYPESWRFVSKDFVVEYLNFLQNKGYSLSTINRKTSVVRSFILYLSDVGEVKPFLFDSLPVPKSIQRKPILIEDREIKKVITIIKRDCGPLAKRNLALLILLSSTGMSIGEAAALDLTDIKLERFRVYIRGRKHRALELSQETAGALMDYLRQARPQLAKSPTNKAVFVTKNGSRLTRHVFWLALKKYSQLAVLPKEKLTSRNLRASFAIRQLRHGFDRQRLHEVLGLSKERSLEVYLI